MPFVSRTDSTQFQLPGVVFHSLASPSRGATENAVWRFSLAPNHVGVAHQLTREETIVPTAGCAVVTLDGVSHELSVGCALIVPADVDFALSNPHDMPFEAVAVLPIGGRARMGSAPPFTPPWAE
jgi:quercetin dioxygenase-like cupin family protein